MMQSGNKDRRSVLEIHYRVELLSGVIYICVYLGHPVTKTPRRMGSQLSMLTSSYFTFVYLTLFHYFIFQILDAVSTDEFIFTMHHDNNNICEKVK